MRLSEYLLEEDMMFGPHGISKEKQALIKLFSQKDKIMDKDVHSLAEELNVSPHKLEEMIYAMVHSFWSVGKAMDVGLDKVEVREKEHSMGMKIEMEHVDDEHMAHRIVLDHLAELPDYYTRLKKMEEGE